MKNQKITFLSLLFSVSVMVAAAQPRVQNSACDNISILRQVDSLKTLFEKQGFAVLKEASMTMESEYEIPVIVPLREGTWYKVIFIGDMNSKLYEVRMFDWNEKQVMYKKNMWADVDGNIIDYDYIPKFTEYHMIKPVQVSKKKKNLCGYIMLLKRVKE